jgi:uncharacterized repeat protein (TIGR03803 family)
VFKVDTARRETVLYRFTGGSDGAHPQSPPVLDSRGDLYGTASVGGQGCAQGCGTVYKLEPSSHGWLDRPL